MSSTRTESAETKEATVIIFHHPCPDGIGSALMLAKKFGFDDSVSYIGLNHGDVRVMNDSIQQAIRFPHCKRIIFADIVPPISILQILLETTSHEIILLDHHATAITEISEHKEFVSKYTHSDRLKLHLNTELSGAGISHDFICGETKRPRSISLTQTIDLLTATSNSEVISQFKINESELSIETINQLTLLAKVAENEQIKKNIIFYVFAAIYDGRMNELFVEHKDSPIKSLMKSTQSFFQSIDDQGLSLLDEKGMHKFQQQLKLHQDILREATLLPPLTKDGPHVLFINVNVRSGRTLDAYIIEALKKIPYPAIAMVSDLTDWSSRENFSISLRGASDTINLAKIADELKKENFAVNAGGHARASALQLNKMQMENLILLVEKNKLEVNKAEAMIDSGLKNHSGKIHFWGEKSATLTDVPQISLRANCVKR